MLRSMLPLLGLVGLLFTGLAPAGSTYEPTAEQVTENVYAIIGPTDARTYKNHGMNANYGVITTGEGVILIDSGPGAFSGPYIERAVAAVSDEPIRWVINIGVQDHRWLGNDFFQRQGAEVIAFEQTVKAQERFADQHMVGRLPAALGERFDGTRPAYADRRLEGDTASVTLGGVNIELSLTDAHFPGDAMAYLPQSDVAFTGDLVYVDRLLGIHPWSDPRNGLAAFERLEAIDPAFVVPGHGRVSDMARARRDSGAYYDFLVNTIGQAARDFEPMSEVLDKYEDLDAFRHLEHYEDWHRTNMNRTFVQFESL
ncbi:MBL fold metallo-hydrolase [Guyparkeria hydrothermalis]|uniref:MBL fold metallo-hydrolase n=1 Tax=Guyparkeria hydrothermalis TaxID=923 RepID=UPI00202087A7|nr:MBL fold metallo-hydrolase [Guyparkeria hydrothermalis]MCL7744087.1 MBL fold metallo-hydrolase [Guyparkeria hydrothermalis]